MHTSLMRIEGQSGLVLLDRQAGTNVAASKTAKSREVRFANWTIGT